jgi:hypothetical protein
VKRFRKKKSWKENQNMNDEQNIRNIINRWGYQRQAGQYDISGSLSQAPRIHWLLEVFIATSDS